MLDFPRWKVRLIVGGLLLLVLFSIPSFFSKEARDSWPGWVPKPAINLGLDLAGGSYLLLEADTSQVAKARLDQMSSTVLAEIRRSAKIDIGRVTTDGGKVRFMVKDASKVDAVREKLNPFTTGAGLTGQRDWDIQVVNSQEFVLTPTEAGITQAIDRAMGDAREIIDKRINALGTLEPTIVRQGTNRIVVQVPGLKDPQALKNLIGKTAKLEFRLVYTGEVDPTQTSSTEYMMLPDAESGGQVPVGRTVELSGDQLIDAQMEFDQRDNQPGVVIRFDGAGTKRFARLSTDNVGKRFAIIVDNVVISAPSFREAILGGVARIDGSFTSDSANQLAIALRSGKLPVDLKVVQESTVSPDLGADSIRAGMLASAIAAVAVIVFMILAYGRFGVYATIAVVINILVILAVMGMLNATLTLPGIAGFVLTIGTAVDANVLINERIREERRRGRNVMQALELGYKEASRTIFEANVTHAIAGMIMLILGSGPIRGFAVVLLIGIATSVFTAVVFTRMLASIWYRRNRPSEIHI